METAMRTRLLQPASLIAAGAAFVGFVGIVSALTPEAADRFQIVGGVLPPGMPEGARVVALAFGLLLVWLWRSLVRRKHRAWQLAVALVVGSTVAHLAKGLDFEEATSGIVLLVALVRWRREFSAPGDPAGRGQALRMAGLAAGLAGVLWLRSVDHIDFSARIEDALIVVLGFLAVRALTLWFQPLVGLGPCAEERAQAEELVARHGQDSLSFFALRKDKSYFFSPSGRSFLAYRVVNGCALVSGDPIGAADEIGELVDEFRRVARSRAWRLAFLGVGGGLLPLYKGRGFRTIYLGDEAIVHPDQFSLEGRQIRKVRQSVARLEREGYTARFLAAHELDDALRAQLAEVSDEWRGRWPERGFTMAMDSLFAYDEGIFAIAEDAEGRVGGFIQLVPSPASGGYSLATMRRRRDTPNGLMEFLVVSTIEWGKMLGVPELSLNFSVMGGILRAATSRPKRMLRFALLKADRLFQIERLHSFNRKFMPEWRPRYICAERWSDMPAIGVAYLHAESLLTPPGPWTKSEALA
jgi:lysyl-tRNA synthetase class 2